ncbi:MAG: nuclear transport factor 2 family protein [Capnocytophaga felis]|nr:nuclear transport factor 2 family protein [Capnocytophaga felis]
MKQTELVQKFYDSLAKGDFETVNILLTDDLIWHQPGKGVLSGSYEGKDVVFAHLSRMAELSKGSFGIEVDFISENRNLVAVGVHFSLSVDGNSMAMKGIDVFRIEENKICEVWLFSERIEEEDAFWTNLAK